MKKMNQIYCCKQCGNIVQLVHVGEGALCCCGEKMELLDEQTADTDTEKHVPVITKIKDGYEVVVGSTLHPMLDNHHIEWVELLANGCSYRQYLTPGDEPKAVFYIPKADNIVAREYCNLHGLWKNEL